MKTMHQIILATFNFILVIGNITCNKEKVVETLPYVPDYGGTTNIELVWKSYIDEKKIEALNINPYLNSNGDVLMSSFSIHNPREPMLLFDGITGVLKWKWDDYLRDEEGFMDRSHVAENDVLVLCSHNATYALNLLTGQTLWRHYSDTMWGSPFIFSDKKGYIYHSFEGEVGNNTNYIFRTKIDQLNWELVCTNSDSVDQPFDSRYIDNMTFATNSKGEQLLIYELLRTPNAYDPHTTMACYNMDQKKYVWIKNYTDKYNVWDPPKMLTDNKRIYAFASKAVDTHLLALDIDNGEIVWDNAIPTYGINMFLFNGNIISLCPNGKPLISYDAQTGKINWTQTFTPAEQLEISFGFGSDVIYKNYLISTQCEKLLVIDLNNGNKLFYKQALRGIGCMEYGVAINPQKGVFYVGDRLYVHCFKLPAVIKRLFKKDIESEK